MATTKVVLLPAVVGVLAVKKTTDTKISIGVILPKIDFKATQRSFKAFSPI